VQHVALWAFIAGWMTASLFIAAGLWVRHRWHQVEEVLDFPDTTHFLVDYQGHTHETAAADYCASYAECWRRRHVYPGYQR